MTENELIYIGKAKDLRNRVNSYFNKDINVNAKTRVLVSKIRNITFTIVDTEVDAWLLENSMIKKHQPRYNVMLKDDKTYPWIIIKNENFPRIFWTRRIIRDGSKYLGPYASVSMMHAILGLDQRNLSAAHLQPGAYAAKILMQANLKFAWNTSWAIAKGPAKITRPKDDYDHNIEEIKDILNGKIGAVVRNLKADMENAVAESEF